MLLLRFGFAEQPTEPNFTGYSYLSSGYISVSQENKVGEVVSAQHDFLFLVMDLLDIMSGISEFFHNSRTKHWSFSATDAECSIHLDRRKRAMIYLQINDLEGLYPEVDVIAAFQEAIVRFYEDEYARAQMSIGPEGLSGSERGIDREFREYYQDFITMQAND